jgi:hypothetical protein
VTRGKRVLIIFIRSGGEKAPARRCRAGSHYGTAVDGRRDGSPEIVVRGNDNTSD